MNSETKLFVGIILATVVFIVGAAFIFSRPTTASFVDPKVLVHDNSHKIGSASAIVTLVEFSDFQCPACGAYHPVVKQLLNKYADSLSLVFRHFPLPAHANAVPAARAAEAAGKQGKFWEMYDKLYETQNDWSLEKNPTDVFASYAKGLGLNTEQFSVDLENRELQKRIDTDIADGNVLRVNQTPTFFLNNKKIENPASLEDFEVLIKAEISKTK